MVNMTRLFPQIGICGHQRKDVRGCEQPDFLAMKM
jgi:hypothetical protein